MGLMVEVCSGRDKNEQSVQSSGHYNYQSHIISATIPHA